MKLIHTFYAWHSIVVFTLLNKANECATSVTLSIHFLTSQH